MAHRGGQGPSRARLLFASAPRSFQVQGLRTCPQGSSPQEDQCSGLCSPSHTELTVLEASVIMSPGLVD